MARTCNCRIWTSKSNASRRNASSDGRNWSDASRSMMSSFLNVGGKLSCKVAFLTNELSHISCMVRGDILTLYSSDSSPSPAGGCGGAKIFFGIRRRFAEMGVLRAKWLRSCWPEMFLLCMARPSYRFDCSIACWNINEGNKLNVRKIPIGSMAREETRISN